MRELYRRLVNAIIECLVNHSYESVHPKLLSRLCQMYNLSLIRQIWRSCPESSLIVITWQSGHPSDPPAYDLFDVANRSVEGLLRAHNTLSVGGGWSAISDSFPDWRDGAYWELFNPWAYKCRPNFRKFSHICSAQHPLTLLTDFKYISIPSRVEDNQQ